MLIYILKFSACLTIFIVFYKLFLEKSSIHSFKRFYLLGALGLAFVIPSLTFIEYIEPMVFEDFEMIEPMISFDEVNTVPLEAPINYTPIILWSIYGLGVFIFLLKFCLNLYRIISKIKNNPKLKSSSFINVLVTNLMIPHTFFNYIFLNKHKFEHAEIPKEVLLHEQTHAKQKHSIDVLILEFLQILFWFNPLIYFLKKEVKLNHEFLADRAVLLNGIQPSAYQQLLLAFSSSANEPQLANAINYSSIKKRFTVMKTKTSKSSIWFRSLLILPVLAILLYSFTERKQVVKETSDLIEFNSSEGVSDELMKEYNDFIIAFNTTHRINYSEYERIVSIYNLMSDKQKASVEQYPKVPEVDLSKTKAKVPTTAEFESWKNDKEFAIWIDGVHVPNARLNSYTLNDIAHFVGSFVHKNARSKKFPQPYQFSLYTKKGFKETYQESKVKQYRELTKKYSKAIDVFLKGDRLDNSELILLNERCYRLYKSFSEEEKKQHNLLPPPPPPARKPPQQGATPKQIAEYNRIAKAYNKKPLGQRIIKVKDFKKLESLYKQMSAEQKKDAQAFPEFPHAPPRPAKSNKNPSSSLPSEFAIQLNDSLTLHLTGGNEIQQKELKARYNMSDALKKQLDSRRLILLATEKTEKTSTYKIDGKPASISQVNNFINDFPNASIEATENSNGSLNLSFSNSDHKIMSDIELQSVYSKIFSKIDSNNNLINTNTYRAKPTGNGPNSNEKTSSSLPLEFTIQLNDSLTLHLTGANEIQQKESKAQSNMSDALKKQLNSRKVIVLATEKTEKKSTYKIDGKPASKSQINKYINDYPTASIKITENSNGSLNLSFSNSDHKIMSDIELQSVYSKIFSKIDSNKNLINTNGYRVKPTGNGPKSNEPHAIEKQQKSKEPVKINGKTPVNDQLTLGKHDFKNLKLTLDDADITNFKFKVPGKPSCSNTGNTLNNLSKKLLRTVSSDKVVQFFDIKDSKGFVHPPIVVKISDKLVGVLGTTELLVMINGKTPVNDQLTLSKKEFEDLKLTMKKLEVKSFKLKIQGKRSQHIIGNYLDEKAKSYIKDISEGSVVQFFDIKCTNKLKLKPIIVTVTK